ncbi:Eceriferum-like protein, partial [Thalictrum thalictroides]
MGSIDVKSNIYDVKLSSVVPATMTGENVVHELSNMDLLMKLHYIKGVYYFNTSAVQGLTITDFKLQMFTLLEQYYFTCGRIRKSESGRPFIKCNDSGVRIIEAKCSMTLDECLAEKDSSVHRQLLPNQVLGPELAYSPLVLIQ